MTVLLVAEACREAEDARSLGMIDSDVELDPSQGEARAGRVVHLVAPVPEYGAKAVVIAVERQDVLRLVPGACTQGEDRPVLKQGVLDAEVGLARVLDHEMIELRGGARR